MADTVTDRQRQLVARLRDRAAHVGECDWPRLRDELHALADLAAGIGADLIALASERQRRDDPGGQTMADTARSVEEVIERYRAAIMPDPQKRADPFWTDENLAILASAHRDDSETVDRHQIASENRHVGPEYDYDAVLLERQRSHEQVVKALEKPPNLMGLYTKVCNVLDSESNPREQKMAIGALFDEFLAAALASGDPAPAHETDHARVDRNADADR